MNTQQKQELKAAYLKQNQRQIVIAHTIAQQRVADFWADKGYNLHQMAIEDLTPAEIKALDNNMLALAGSPMHAFEFTAIEKGSRTLDARNALGNFAIAMIQHAEGNTEYNGLPESLDGLVVRLHTTRMKDYHDQKLLASEVALYKAAKYSQKMEDKLEQIAIAKCGAPCLKVDTLHLSSAALDYLTAFSLRH